MNKNTIYDIQLDKVPNHIAIIMDGNGRWAKSRFLPRTAGHKAGVETKAIVYNGLGHAYFDNCGVLPQTEDCIEEMGKFIIEHTK